MPIFITYSATPDTGGSPLTVIFEGSAPFVSTIMYNIIFDFGDGSPTYTIPGPIPSVPGYTNIAHTYTTPGVYNATVTFNTDVNVVIPVQYPSTITVTSPSSTVVSYTPPVSTYTPSDTAWPIAFTISGLPNGTLTFYNGTDTLGSTPVVSGAAEYDFKANDNILLPGNTYTIVAQFTGDEPDGGLVFNFEVGEDSGPGAVNLRNLKIEGYLRFS